MALAGLGMILAASNAAEQAINHCRQAINLSQEVGGEWWERMATTGLSRLRAHLDHRVPAGDI